MARPDGKVKCILPFESEHVDGSSVSRLVVNGMRKDQSAVCNRVLDPGPAADTAAAGEQRPFRAGDGSCVPARRAQLCGQPELLEEDMVFIRT